MDLKLVLMACNADHVGIQVPKMANLLQLPPAVWDAPIRRSQVFGMFDQHAEDYPELLLLAIKSLEPTTDGGLAP